MNPARRDLQVWKGNSEEFSFRVKDASGQAFDLTGSTISMWVDYDSVVASVQATIPTPVTGEFTVILPASLTKILTADDYIPNYEIIRSSNAETKTLLFGNLFASGAINHA